MKKRLIDIYSPSAKRQEAWQEERPANEGEIPGKEPTRFAIGRQKSMVGGVAALLILPFVALHVFFAQAHVKVWPQMTQLEIEETAVAQAGAENVSLAKQIVRAKTLEQEKVASGVFQTTGQKEKEEHATGSIRVYNKNADSSQTLVASTRFISQEGRLFRSQERIVIPAGSFVDVDVRGAEPGEEYNIGPSNFSLPGLAGSSLYTQIYGESFAPMRGGAARRVPVVTQSDIAAAKVHLVERGTTLATEALLARIPGEFQVLEESIASSAIEDSSLVKEGAELERFNYRITVRVSAFAFHRGDVEMLARQLVQGYLSEGETIDESTFSVATSVEPAHGNSRTRVLKLNIAAARYEELDERRFLEDLRGASRREFQGIMTARPFLAKTEFSLWPFWTHTVPRDQGRIRLEVVLGG